jgi:hypothetical protein
MRYESSLWALIDDSGEVIIGTARTDKPTSPHFAGRMWLEFTPKQTKANQCAETCERAKLCAVCQLGVAP